TSSTATAPKPSKPWGCRSRRASSRRRTSATKFSDGAQGWLLGVRPGSWLDPAAIQLCCPWGSYERERGVELGQQQLEHAAYALLAAHRQTPQHRSADHHGACSQRERLDHVGAAVDAAVGQHVEITARLVNVHLQ